jgi:chromosome segregation ATPase
VDVAAEAGEQPLPDSVFDPIGRSLVATLNQGEKTEFREGDEATFDFATAQELINQGKAEQVQPIYYRRLRDYARAFRGLTADLAELARQLELAQVDLDKRNKSVAELQTQLAFQTQQRERLADDLDGLNTERTVLGQFVAGLEQKWGELRAELSRTYRANRQLVNRMAAAP